MNNEITKTEKKDIRSLVQSMAGEILKAIPKHMSADRMIRIFLTTIRDKKLGECTQESLLHCLMKCSQAGLEPDGRMAHIVAYGDVATVLFDWKGLADIIWRSGVVQAMRVSLVFSGERFTWREGSNGCIEHEPMISGDRGKCIGAYAMVMINGAWSWDVMRMDEIISIRNASQGYRSAIKYNKPNPWINFEGEMAKKTVFKRLSKILPFSPEIRDQLDDDDKAELSAEDLRIRNAIPVLATVSDPPEFPEHKHHAQLRKILEGASISEASFLAKMRELGLIDDAFNDINMIGQGDTEKLIQGWKELEKHFK